MHKEDAIQIITSILAGILVAGDIAADHNNQRNCRYFRTEDGKSGILDAAKAVADARAIVAAAERSVDLDKEPNGA